MQQLLPRAAFGARAYAVRPRHSLAGVGDARTDQQILGFSTTTAGAALPALVSAGWIAASAVPFIGAGLAVAASLASWLIQNSGCGQTCIVTSQWANQAADALQKVVDAYYSQPAPRSKSSQQLALQAFDQIWARLVQMCSDPQWGDAGKRCVSDRQAGACVWHQKYAPVYGTEPQIGECWNWFNGYRDVIAKDPHTVDDTQLAVASAAGSGSSAIAGAVDSVAAAVSGVSPIVWLGGAVLLAAFAMSGGNDR